MANAEQWERWFAAFGSELQSVIPRGSISDTIKPELHGKVPGYRLPNGKWVGLTGPMADRHMTEAEMRQAAADGADIGMLGRNFPAVDIDIDDPALAADFTNLAISLLGPAPMRRRAGSARRLLMYAGRMRRNRLTFIMPPPALQKTQGIEILAEGQYYNVEGRHPAGEFYVWPAGHPCDLGPFGLEPLMGVTPFFEMIAYQLRAKHGCIITGFFGHEGLPEGSEGKIQRFNLDSPSFVAPHPKDVLAVLAGWHPPAPMGHDQFVLTMAAIKASLGAAREQFWDEVLEWCPPPRDREPTASRKVWDSIRDSAVGWAWLLKVSGSDVGAQMAFSVPVAGPAVVVGRGPDAAAVTAMMERYVWCEVQDKFCDVATGELLSGKAFAARNTVVARMGVAGKKTAENMFFNDPRCRRVWQIGYLPGKERLTTQDIDGLEQPVFNIWRPSDVAPVRGVRPIPWLEHVSMLFDKADGEHFLDFEAFVLQQRGVKINHAMLLYSARQGTGKDSALHPLVMAIGQHNVGIVSAQGLLEPFTPYLPGELVLLGEMESFEKGSSYNKFKDLTTIPPMVVAINHKHMKQFLAPKTANWIATTNKLDAVRMEESDRRFWMAECNDARVGDTEYFNALWNYYDNGGVAEVMGYLLDRDISKFNPKAAPPMTAIKRTALDAARSPTKEWLDEQLDGPFRDRTVLSVQELTDRRFGLEALRRIDIFTTLRARGWMWSGRQYRHGEGRRIRLWTKGKMSDETVVLRWKQETASGGQALLSTSTQDWE